MVQVELLPIGPRAVPAMSPSAIAELDSFTYDEPGLANKGVTERQLRHAPSGAGAVPPAEAAVPPSCRICHSEYATGERLRQLPCQHIFHKACIDEWLGCFHATCPVCRMNLLGGFKSPRLSRILASSGRAESAYVSARRHLSGGYSGTAYMDSMPSASSGGLEGEAPRWAPGSAAPLPCLHLHLAPTCPFLVGRGHVQCVAVGTSGTDVGAVVHVHATNVVPPYVPFSPVSASNCFVTARSQLRPYAWCDVWGDGGYMHVPCGR